MLLNKQSNVATSNITPSINNPTELLLMSTNERLIDGYPQRSVHAEALYLNFIIKFQLSNI